MTRARTQNAAVRPRILINCASSIDGKIAYPDGSRARLSGPEDLRRMHAMRNRVDAILVGVGTVLADDPSLSVKEEHVRGKLRTPAKVVLDSSCRTPPGARLLASPGTAIIVTAEECVESVPGAEMLRCGSGRVDLERLMAALAARGIRTVMVEGGGETIASFLSAGLWDEMTVYCAPVVIGGEGGPTIADGEVGGAEAPAGTRLVSVARLGEGFVVKYRPAASRRAKR
jgi:2,5-diamino-6-(ribosylamino)-4(3H)-pyrimidinone 5'-phosphate reductase